MMFWFALLLLAFAALVPLALAARMRAALYGRREAALTLHRAQLAELDRDFAQGRLLPAEQAAAKLEVERRLLASAALTDLPTNTTSIRTIAVLALVIPVAAYGLYRIGGHPELVGAVPPPPPQAEAAPPDAAEIAGEDNLVQRLHTMLAQMDPHSPRAQEGYRLLGRVELGRRHFAGAIEAWHQVLAVAFDPTIAAMCAEVIAEQAGKITPESVALWRRALKEAPADAPWRPMAEKRLAEAPLDALQVPNPASN